MAGPPKSVIEKDRVMVTGTVKWFNSQKGYGFIAPSNGALMYSSTSRPSERAGLSGLNEGQQIDFDTEIGRTGSRPR